MKQLKRLALSLTLMSALSVTAFGETNSSPCLPGEVQSPPCAAQSTNDAPVIPSETLTPSAAPSLDVTYIAETVMWALSLF